MTYERSGSLLSIYSQTFTLRVLSCFLSLCPLAFVLLLFGRLAAITSSSSSFYNDSLTNSIAMPSLLDHSWFVIFSPLILMSSLLLLLHVLYVLFFNNCGGFCSAAERRCGCTCSIKSGPSDFLERFADDTTCFFLDPLLLFILIESIFSLLLTWMAHLLCWL